ncbi:MAG: hypothetical protein ACREJ3_13940, partial [Polyangiaceae bacterium]
PLAPKLPELPPEADPDDPDDPKEAEPSPTESPLALPPKPVELVLPQATIDATAMTAAPAHVAQADFRIGNSAIPVGIHASLVRCLRQSPALVPRRRE